MSNGDTLSLCQPDDGKSCGACCGIYNYADSSRTSLADRLRRRTARFRTEVRGPADLAGFSQRTRAAEDQRQRFTVIYCCEFVGFLDSGERRVGCLLHPAQNGGRDLREVSFYGQALCAGHRCPSDQFLAPAEKRALIHVLEDWYLYGLCLTDIDLVKQFFRRLADRLGAAVDPERFRSGAVRERARDFFAFKAAWPYRSPEVNRFGRFSCDGTQHMIRPIDYASLGCEGSPFDGILQSLTSRFRDQRELRQAEALIGTAIDRCAAAYSGELDFR